MDFRTQTDDVWITLGVLVSHLTESSDQWSSLRYVSLLIIHTTRRLKSRLHILMVSVKPHDDWFLPLVYWCHICHLQLRFFICWAVKYPFGIIFATTNNTREEPVKSPVASLQVNHGFWWFIFEPKHLPDCSDCDRVAFTVELAPWTTRTATNLNIAGYD